MIIFFYGENDFKIKQKLKELEDKFIKEVDLSGQNIFRLDGEKIKLEDFSAKLSSNSLFCQKRMIIINDLIKNKQKNILKELLDYLQKNKIDKSNDIFIFIEKNIKSKNNKDLLKLTSEQEAPLNIEEKKFYNFLSSQKYAQEIKNFNSLELSNFIKQEITSYNLKIDARDIQLLIALVGNNPWTLSNEIKKLAYYKPSSSLPEKIQKNDIEKVVTGIFTENIFSFTDAISTRNTKLALKILEEQYLSGLNPDYILSMLLRQFKILLQIRELLDTNYNSQKIISSLKLHPFIINKGINQAKNFEKNTIKRFLNNLIEIENLNRKSQINLKVYLGLLIADL
ncbi:MAG TPA: DNA polymerase III subunit delta [bacterium]|nr:DNA polymerase III subunit delta [bacterium]